MSRPSALFLHVCALYDELQKRADDGGMFVGSKTDAFRATGLAHGYYSKLYRYLTEMGCIVTVQRGSRRLSSIVQLVAYPEQIAFNNVHSHFLTDHASSGTVREDEERGFDRLNERVLSIEQRLAAIEAQLSREE